MDPIIHDWIWMEAHQGQELHLSSKSPLTESEWKLVVLNHNQIKLTKIDNGPSVIW